MIVQPVLHPVLLVLLCAAPAFFVIRALIRTPHAGAPGRPIWALRLGMIVVVFAMLLRPGIPGGTSQTLATDTDIVIVVDTTASIIAEDWNGDQPRLTGVRADVQSIVDTYPGARFSLISFDAAAQLRLPLTTDATALMSSLDVMLPEITDQSRGSSISIANRMLTDTLRAAAKASPDRSRMVFYLGDGEQTSSSEPESFSGGAKYVDGGLVLGYGTAEGGPMKKTTGRAQGSDDSPGEYIEYQGERAMSVIDEDRLKKISEQLGVDYQHRTADAEIALPEAPSSTTDYATAGEVGNVIELYWILALALIALVAVELVRATMLVTRLRELSRPATDPAAVPAPTPAPAPAPAPDGGAR
ncbi:Ca-activated chloride channel family protein [Microbacterium sp. W4I4]|uniref:VWA domain-containing protein n=1 Tax=Microbacterium sp. W4I4 TaxID=3042295 RepID=UPI002780B8FB|nr:VWA domain-containing protein [Microbacterium sp. W4I4]MDQ0614566.1 Ca-activated chloride channel family protein [Microbacterium sp. W4I4]